MDDTSSELVELATSNLHEQFLYLPSRLAALETNNPKQPIISASDQLWAVDSGEPMDMTNIICRSRANTATIRSLGESAIQTFAAKGYPFAWWVCPGDNPPQLQSLLSNNKDKGGFGLQCNETETLMAMHVTPATQQYLHSYPTVPMLKILQVNSSARLVQWSSIIEKLAPPDAKPIRRFYDRCKPILLDPTCPYKLFLGIWDGKPVATSGVFLTRLEREGAQYTIGGIYGVASLPEVRGKGIGTSMTTHAMCQAVDNEATCIALSASEMGRRIYSTLGMKNLGLIYVYGWSQ